MARRWYSYGPDVSAWIEASCVLPSGEHIGRPFRLMPWQKEWVNELYACDAKGNPKERFEALKAADFLTPNEKRALENRDRVDDPRADMLWMPLNMMPIGEGAVAMEERLARLQAAKAGEDSR